MSDTLTKGSRITGADRTTLGASLAERYQAGESIRALAEDIGRSFGFVHGVITEAGVPLRGRGGPTRGAAATASASAATTTSTRPAPTRKASAAATPGPGPADRTAPPAEPSPGKKATGKKATGKKATGKKATGKKATGKKATGKKATKKSDGETTKADSKKFAGTKGRP
ncbi:helix-turn-helix domain-containing protein [uncultured Friedmanniella sp.]|uniref:helix-turn-helix domain-containing protein n=1 Tax=uncultured Friedmanniella sp. TaxID=335381 RepID=UPI0035CB7A83